MNGLFLLTGSNLGNRQKTLCLANEAIAQSIGPIIKASSLYLSKPWGVEDQPDFLNQVLQVETALPPDEVMRTVLEIEESLGRIRKLKWGSRLIDIDILYYGDMVIDRKNLTVPHPMMQERRFTLVPLTEIAPDLMHPILRKTSLELLADCPDPLPVERWAGGSDRADI